MDTIEGPRAPAVKLTAGRGKGGEKRRRERKKGGKKRRVRSPRWAIAGAK